jgi:pantoate--beta-alanine ligase
MKIIYRALDMQQVHSTSVGFVPTMGALHTGHLSLIERAKRENQIVAVSIFVNPTQFNNPNDLEKYPRPMDADVALLENAGVDYLFLPTREEIYPDTYRFRVSENLLSSILCGPTRPGHFDGVLTIVLKLLQIVSPARAYFGEKDYQQFLLIRDMAQAFFLKSEIVPCPTVREADGLAMSSRNTLLTSEQRERAPFIYKTIRTAKSAIDAREALTAAGFRVDYVEDHFNRRFVAAFLGDVRLIDNVEI